MNSWLVIKGEGDRLRLRTSELFVARRRRRFRGMAALAALAGVMLVALSPWFLALVVLGVVGVVVAPRLFATAELLEIDRARGLLVTLQPGADRGRSVAVSDVKAVCGMYEVFGWDPRSTIYATLANGERAPLLVFAGTDEELAEEACRLLGRYLDAEATYAGPYGAPTVCFSPFSNREHEPTT